MSCHLKPRKVRFVGVDSPFTPKAALLQALARGPGFGLELIARVKELTTDRIELLQGTIYPLLRAMEEEGLIESQDGPPAPERGGRPRRYYKLTADGMKAAAEQSDIAAVLCNWRLVHDEI